jgi:hypothetical protein
MDKTERVMDKTERLLKEILEEIKKLRKAIEDLPGRETTEEFIKLVLRDKASENSRKRLDKLVESQKKLKAEKEPGKGFDVKNLEKKSK